MSSSDLGLNQDVDSCRLCMTEEFLDTKKGGYQEALASWYPTHVIPLLEDWP